MEPLVREIAGFLKDDQVNAVLLVPVWPNCTRAESALGHYLEAEGLPTTQISLVRMHTEVIQPPRALWVPFDLGWSFGTPGEAAFQRRVISAVLALFERESGPVLEDSPEDAPGEAPLDAERWSCPVALGAPPPADAKVGSLEAALLQEFDKLRPWYDVACQVRDSRTTVGSRRWRLTTLFHFLRGFSAPRGRITHGTISPLGTHLST